MPSVSIITALHNKGPYVAETVRSVLAQTMADWELIVVENGSDDNGPEIVRQFKDSRIHLVVSPRCGPGVARNLGLGFTTGEWILFLDADDLIEPDYLAERLGLLKKHPKANLLAGCWEEFKADDPNHKTIRQPVAINGTAQDVANAAIAYAPWALHAALVKNDRLKAGRSWPEEMDGLPSEDTAFWFPVVHMSTVAWSARGGALYRIQTANSRNEIKAVEQWIHAVLGVIHHNVNYLKLLNERPNDCQCANIIRVLESAYRLGVSGKAQPEAKLALQQAMIWLSSRPSSSPALVLRKLLGLRLFNLLRYGVI